MRFRVIGRLLQIQRVLVRHGLDEMILAAHLFRPLRFSFYLSPATWFERRKGGPRGERIRLALEELGPIWVKLGQALSTRRDLIPPDIADELEKLQDRVPPFPGSEAKAIIEGAYGRSVGEVFAEFDETPLASFDENAYAASCGANDRPLETLLGEFAAVRGATLALLRWLPEAAWTRRGTASGKEVSVRALAWISAGHAAHHERVLTERYGVV
jgi:hypothetical protein